MRRSPPPAVAQLRLVRRITPAVRSMVAIVLLLGGCSVPVEKTRYFIAAPAHRGDGCDAVFQAVRDFALASGYTEVPFPPGHPLSLAEPASSSEARRRSAFFPIPVSVAS